MIYVALLRGINVGGKTRVEMARLKKVMESLGCSNVKTYINSGNVIFEDDQSEKVLQTKIFDAIEKEFGFSVAIQLRSQKQMATLVNAIPKEWTNDTEYKSDVLFLDETLTEAIVKPYIKVNPKIVERTLSTKREIIWNIARRDATRGRLATIVGTDMYKHITIRNVNTVLRLHYMMDELANS